MDRPITTTVGRLTITATLERQAEIRKAMAAVKAPTVKQARAAALRKQDKRLYPRFIQGGNTADYVAAYWRLNGQGAGLACEWNRRTGLSTPMDGEVERLIGGFYLPLGTAPQFTPVFDGVEESAA